MGSILNTSMIFQKVLLSAFPIKFYRKSGLFKMPISPLLAKYKSVYWAKSAFQKTLFWLRLKF